MKCPSCDSTDRVTFMHIERREGGKFVELLLCCDPHCYTEFDGAELDPEGPEVQGYLAAEEESGRRPTISLRRASECGGSFEMTDALALVTGDGQVIALIDHVLLPTLVLWMGTNPIPMPPCTNVLEADESLEEAQQRMHKWWIKQLVGD